MHRKEKRPMAMTGEPPSSKRRCEGTSSVILPVPQDNVSSTEMQPVASDSYLTFWSTMLFGNSATCSKGPSFNWSHVEHVELNGTKYYWSDKSNDKIFVVMGTPSFTIDDEYKHCTEIRYGDSDGFGSRARQIVSILPDLCNTRTICQRVRTAVLEESSDSGDEMVPDEEILPAFSEQDWANIQSEFDILRRHYVQAKKGCFENAVGKYFLSKFMQFCCMVQPENRILKEYVSMGTSPSGSAQPGCSRFHKICPGRRGRSHSVPSSATSSATSSPAPDAPGTSTELATKEKLEKIETRKYADVCYWDELKCLYPIVGEAKSSDDQPVENQLTDQMFGLFRPYQKMMLGFGVKSNEACIKILEKDKRTLYCRNYTNINLHCMEDLQQLARLFIAFIFFLDCGKKE